MTPTLRRIFTLVAPHKTSFVIAIAMLFIMAATEPAFPQVLKYLLDEGFTTDTARAIWLVPFAIIVIFLVRGVTSFVSYYLMCAVENKLLAQLRNQIFDRVLDLPLHQIAEDQGALTINLMMQEVRKLATFITTFITGVLRNLLTIFLLIAYLFYLNWQLSLITFIMVPLIALALRFISRRLRKLNRDLINVNENMIDLIQEATLAGPVIRIFGGQNYERKRLESHNNAFRYAFLRISVASGLAAPVTQMFASIAVIIVIVVSLMQVQYQDATAGSFISFITAMLMILAPLKQIADANNLFQQMITGAEQIFKWIDHPTEQQLIKQELVQAPAPEKIVTDSPIAIQFDNVSFTYPISSMRRTSLPIVYSTRTSEVSEDYLPIHPPVLTDIHITIHAGQTVAFVGMSGSGKTSLLNLIPMFYQPTQGRILLDDVDIKNINLLTLRKKIATVGQHVVLFNDTLAANIAYGQDQIDLEKIEQVLGDANLEEVVAQLPQGIETNIGNNGMLLSGGQRQRVAIARALYKNAPILLLDEATSALDSQSERKIQTALSRLIQGRTTLVVAHRLSTIERADLIVVLYEGRIVERGTHLELLAKNSAYAELHRLQFSNHHEALI